MLILDFKLNNLEESELEYVDYFCNYLIEVIQTKINTPFIKQKIQSRIPYMYTLPWIKYIKRNIEPEYVLQQIQDSIIYDIKELNYIDILIDNHNAFKNTYTPTISILKFLNNGDYRVSGIRIYR